VLRIVASESESVDAGPGAETDLRLYADVFRNLQVGLNVWRLADRQDPRTLTLVSSNPAAAQSLGIRTEDVVGKRMDEAFPHLLETDLPHQCREVVLSGVGRDLGTVRSGLAERADDGLYAVKVFPLPDDCVGVAFESVAARERLEAQLLQAQKVEAIGRLAAGVAQDFDNVVGVILGYTELLMRGAKVAQRRRLDEILKAAQRASALTRQLLAFSRKPLADPQVLDLNSLVAALEEMLRRLVGEEVELAIVFGNGLGQVRADSAQVQQVVMNLCANARDAMPAGGVLRVETANVELEAGLGSLHEPIAAGRYVMLAVSDSGGGGENIDSSIFDPFFTTKEDGSTGFGLATVYGVVTQALGYVQVDTAVGRGSSFRIYLPRIDEPLGTALTATTRT
jgi:signal transduction histidine kinase